MLDFHIVPGQRHASTRARALAHVTQVLVAQAALLQADFKRRLLYKMKARLAVPAEQRAALDLEVQRAEELLNAMNEILADPDTAARARFDALLGLLGGPVTRLDLDDEHLAAWVHGTHARGRTMRMLLVPHRDRRRRVLLQNMQRGRADSLDAARPYCLGPLGHSYVAATLNRLDLRGLVLAMTAYLRVN